MIKLFFPFLSQKERHSTLKLIFAHILALWSSALICAHCTFALQSHPQGASLFSLEIELHFRAWEDNICHISKKNTKLLTERLLCPTVESHCSLFFTSGIKSASPNVMSSGLAIYNHILNNCVALMWPSETLYKLYKHRRTIDLNTSKALWYCWLQYCCEVPIRF